MSIFGFNILVNTPQTIAAYSFQGISKGAHLFVRNYSVKQAKFYPFSQRRSNVGAWATLADFGCRSQKTTHPIFYATPFLIHLLSTAKRK